jgi:hypothetical protein
MSPSVAACFPFRYTLALERRSRHEFHRNADLFSPGSSPFQVSSSRWVELALKILNGFDYRQMKRVGDEIRVGESSIGKTNRQHNQQLEMKQQEWLKKKGLE